MIFAAAIKRFGASERPWQVRSPSSARPAERNRQWPTRARGRVAARTCVGSILGNSMSLVSCAIDELVRLRSEAAMARVASAAKEDAFGADDIYRLANGLAQSGVVMS